MKALVIRVSGKEHSGRWDSHCKGPRQKHLRCSRNSKKAIVAGKYKLQLFRSGARPQRGPDKREKEPLQSVMDLEIPMVRPGSYIITIQAHLQNNTVSWKHVFQWAMTHEALCMQEGRGNG